MINVKIFSSMDMMLRNAGGIVLERLSNSSKV